MVPCNQLAKRAHNGQPRLHHNPGHPARVAHPGGTLGKAVSCRHVLLFFFLTKEKNIYMMMHPSLQAADKVLL